MTVHNRQARSAARGQVQVRVVVKGGMDSIGLMAGASRALALRRVEGLDAGRGERLLLSPKPWLAVVYTGKS